VERVFAVTFRRILLPFLMVAAAAPAAAQFSDSYSFLKAVRDRDGAKANELLGKGSPTLVDTADVSTGERGLHIAVKERDLAWVGFLIQKGARIDLKDGQGNTPLMVAARIGNLEAARILISRNANLNATNSAGETPLIAAVQRRDIAMTRLLLTQGADPARRDTASGLTARDYAVRDGRSEAIIKLMDEIKPVAKKAVAGPR
jgi:ankyrin repeat protein